MNITLQDALKDHVSYEIDMLFGTFNRLAAPIHDEVVANGLIESFCIHARGLIDFLANNDGGLRAKDYTDGYAPRKNIGVSKALYTKLNTQIAHITPRRSSEEAQKIGYADRVELRDRIHAALVQFDEHLKPEFRIAWTYSQPQASSDPSRVATATNAIAQASTEPVSTTTASPSTIISNSIAINHAVKPQR